MMNEILLIAFLTTFIVFIIFLVKRISLYKLKIDLMSLVVHEFKEASKGGVGYMHFSISAGIVLSVLLAIFHYLHPLAFALWIISIPIFEGNEAAAAN